MKADLIDHRKFLRLHRLLGEPKPHVIGYLMLMWRRGYQTGNPYLGDALDVEAAAEYTGEPGRFATAACQAGLIDQLADGNYQIHDLWDHAPEWARKRMARNGYLPKGVSSYCGIVSKSPEKTDAADPPHGRRAACENPPRGGEKLSETKKQRRAAEIETPRGGEKQETDAARRVKERVQIEIHTCQPQAAGEENTSDEKPNPPKPRARDELFDAIIEVTGSDPALHGSQVGRLRRELLGSNPPYQPSEVLRMAQSDFQAVEMPWLEGRRPTIGEVKKYISRVRNPSAGPSAKAALPTKPQVHYDVIQPWKPQEPIPFRLVPEKPKPPATTPDKPKTEEPNDSAEPTEVQPADW